MGKLLVFYILSLILVVGFFMNAVFKGLTEQVSPAPAPQEIVEGHCFTRE